ncbi:aminotransferase class I/II-fold pyridoxal phosphate-dependent enzyme [Frankia sp. EAN1pec]|uniref:aminotransferase class I/II-fold pyridoxal phosphate-dependent enzyme n=1 Tax=Parafrankia sp. (strain EAN1pec) TaxID=298653 RepID=UPI0002F1E007
MSARETAPGALALWLAEMEYPPPDCVSEMVTRYLAGGHLGYSAGFDFATESLRHWARRRYGWATGELSCGWYSGVLHAAAAAVLTLTEPGDAVVVLTPTYPPMLRAVSQLGRRAVRWPLLDEENGYRFDLAALAAVLARERPTLLILNTPHNPTGRVFTAPELRALADQLRDSPVQVLSDEIFADIVYPGARHVPFMLAAGEEVGERTVTVLSASKAFNLAGLRCAAAIAGSDTLACRLARLPAALTGTTTVVGAVASAAAWDHGETWLDTVVDVLAANRDLLFSQLPRRIPMLSGRPPEGTYLGWLRAHGALADSGDVRAELLRAGVDLADGTPFGDESGRRVRLSFACPPDVLAQALDAIAVTCQALADQPSSRSPGRAPEGRPG